MGEGLGWAEARGGERVLTRRADLRHFAAPRRRPLRRRFPLVDEAIGKIRGLTVLPQRWMANFAVRVRRDATVTNVTVATIAKRLGVTDPTVLNDLRASGAKDLAPPTVTGTDGKGVSYGTTWNDLQVIKTDNLLERRIGADGKRYPTRHRREDSEPENVATIANIRRP